MTYVVTDRCVKQKYTDCCAVCPVDCFYELDDPAMLVIDPDTCIDCHLCVPECPVHAIYPDHEVPDPYKEWTEKNRELFPKGTNITKKKDAMPGALTLDQIKSREAQTGWSVSEPTEA